MSKRSREATESAESAFLRMGAAERPQRIFTNGRAAHKSRIIRTESRNCGLNG